MYDKQIQNNPLKVLVLGGNGFIGRNLCNTLYNAGHYVISLGRKIDSSCICNEAVVCDYYNDAALFQYVDQADCIFQTISSISTSNSNRIYMYGYEKDLKKGIELFEYAAKSKKRVYFLSSGGTVYGDAKLIPTPEDAPTEPVSHYGVLKRALESVAHVINNTYGKYVYVIRLANPYGPGQDFKRGIGFIDAVLRRSMNGDEISIWGDGTIVRDYIYIDDACKMMCALLQYNGDDTIFNVGTGIGTSQNDIINIVRNIGLNVNVKYCESRSFDVKRNVLDIKRISSVYPNDLIPIQQGIETYYKYILAQLAKEGKMDG